MKIGQARKIAREWAAEQAGLEGAYLSGSTTWLPADAELAVGSDVDIMVVTGADIPKLGKFPRDGVLLEVSYLTWDQLATPERVLADYHLAAGLRTDTILADPSGRLARLQAEVGRRYAEPEWVRRRCAEVERRIRDGLPGADAMGRLFLTGVTTHVLLTAALRNPTVRTRYVAVRALLAERGLLDVHEELLGLLGSAGMSRAEVEDELAVMTAEFDRAASVEGVPYAFASDISARARPIAVDATRELIGRGLHREIYFWIAATRLRCARILGTEPPPLRLGDTLGYLPRLTEVKELVLAG